MERSLRRRKLKRTILLRKRRSTSIIQPTISSHRNCSQIGRRKEITQGRKESPNKTFRSKKNENEPRQYQNSQGRLQARENVEKKVWTECYLKSICYGWRRWWLKCWGRGGWASRRRAEGRNRKGRNKIKRRKERNQRNRGKGRTKGRREKEDQ